MSDDEQGTPRLTDELDALEILGRGASAMVVRAFHRSRGHFVAVKLLHPKHMANIDMVERFERECVALGEIQSVNVATFLEAGVTESSQPFAVFELLVGLDLATALATEATMSSATAVRRLREAASGVAAAHRAGVIHRDIKPKNIFLHQPAGAASEVVKMVDFGVAKLPPSASRKATADTALIGTPTYMAPEQIRSSAHVDARADVWSLGVVLFETLTGCTPFRRESAIATLDAILHEEPPSLRRLRPEASVALEAIVARCLSKRATDRFADAHALVAALDLATEGREQ